MTTILPVVSVLTTFLFPVERVVLKWVSREFNTSITWKLVFANFREIAANRLAGFVPDAHVFLAKMQTHKHFLSGSFLLQCILGEDWPDSDIDMFFLAKSENTARFADKQVSNELIVHDFSRWLLDQNWVSYAYYETYPHLPIRSVEYCFGDSNKRLNLLQIKPKTQMRSRFHDLYGHCFPEMKDNALHYKSVFDYVDQIADMDFLKIIYDGDVLKVFNWQSLVERKSNISSFRGTYVRGGWDDCQKVFLHRLKSRIEKYTERGFQLDWSSDFHKYYFDSHFRSCHDHSQIDSDTEPDVGKVPRHTTQQIRDVWRRRASDLKTVEDHIWTKHLELDFMPNPIDVYRLWRGSRGMRFRNNKLVAAAPLTHEQQKSLETRYLINKIINNRRIVPIKWKCIRFRNVRNAKKSAKKSKK
jgi:hypothetical protein